MEISMNNQQTGIFMGKVLALACSLMLSLAAVADPLVNRADVTNPTEIWSAWGGEVEMKFQNDIFDDWNLSIKASERAAESTYFTLPVQNLGSLEFHSPVGNFAGFIDGSLTLDQSSIFTSNGQEVSWSQMILKPVGGFEFDTLELQDSAGNTLFYATNIHIYVAQERDQLVMERMDIRVSEALAKRLDNPDLANQFIGELAMELNLNVPAGAVTETRGGTCADRPKWPTEGFIADVGLTNMSQISDVGTIGGGTIELIAPSSSLRNLVGLDGADVPWQQKFQGFFPPYNTDQHPYLIWNLYRVTDGVINQIGRSGVKHAFLTVNSNCTLNCGNNQVLWPGCGDVYGVGNNDSDRDLGPRFEINPLTGVFVSTGSFFDPNGDGAQENFSSDPGENRMQVLREDLQTPDSEYYFESWYVIRDDSNIFNSMGYRPITPTNPGGGNAWTYTRGAFEVGPVIDQWVPPSTDPATGSQNVSFDDSRDIGHLKLAVRTEDLGDGQFQYTYMLANFDVAAGISELNLNVPAGRANGIDFYDVDQNAANDWSVNGSDLVFQAAIGDEMPWGNAYTFTFVGGPPIPGRVTVRTGDINSTRTVDLDILVPELGEEFLIDGFENN